MSLRKEDCSFYHTIDIPGHGLMEGAWDYRDVVDQYFGGVDLAGKRVFEIGVANGFFTIEMEKRGADVTGHDLDENGHPDYFFPPGFDGDAHIHAYRAELKKMHNAWNLATQANESKARMVYGRLNDLPADLGTFDIVTIGAVLLHLREPFSNLESICRHAGDTIIINEQYYRSGPLLRWVSRLTKRPASVFIPKVDPTAGAQATWWFITPELLERWLNLLGFEKTHLSFFKAPYHGKPQPMYTMVAKRK